MLARSVLLGPNVAAAGVSPPPRVAKPTYTMIWAALVGLPSTGPMKTFAAVVTWFSTLTSALAEPKTKFWTHSRAPAPMLSERTWYVPGLRVRVAPDCTVRSPYRPGARVCQAFAATVMFWTPGDTNGNSGGEKTGNGRGELCVPVMVPWLVRVLNNTVPFTIALGPILMLSATREEPAGVSTPPSTPSSTPPPLSVGPTLALLTTISPATTCTFACSRTLLVAKMTVSGMCTGRPPPCVWAVRIRKTPSASRAASSTVKRLRRRGRRIGCPLLFTPGHGGACATRRARGLRCHGLQHRGRARPARARETWCGSATRRGPARRPDAPGGLDHRS